MVEVEVERVEDVGELAAGVAVQQRAAVLALGDRQRRLVVVVRGALRHPTDDAEVAIGEARLDELERAHQRLALR
jgi:hypothetical protein